MSNKFITKQITQWKNSWAIWQQGEIVYYNLFIITCHRNTNNVELTAWALDTFTKFDLKLEIIDYSVYILIMLLMMTKLQHLVQIKNQV